MALELQPIEDLDEDEPVAAPAAQTPVAEQPRTSIQLDLLKELGKLDDHEYQDGARPPFSPRDG